MNDRIISKYENETIFDALTNETVLCKDGARINEMVADKSKILQFMKYQFTAEAVTYVLFQLIYEAKTSVFVVFSAFLLDFYFVKKLQVFYI